ncbi:MAG: RsmE family RNA methyltransferase [Alphaproteobacteria bacterium]
MQNVPRIYLDEILESGKSFPIDKDVVHYLRRVMRRDDCLVFNDGIEYNAKLTDDNKNIVIGEKTNHVDPSNDTVFYFAPIKKADELLNMVTQMGVAVLQPVITERTVANHINWNRMMKIIVEAAEQSNRNTVPELKAPIKFDDLDLNNLIVADERFAHDFNRKEIYKKSNRIFVGPEGGFAPKEFEKMDKAGVIGLSLGKTILRAEVAGVVAIAKVLNK